MCDFKNSLLAHLPFLKNKPYILTPFSVQMLTYVHAYFIMIKFSAKID